VSTKKNYTLKTYLVSGLVWGAFMLVFTTVFEKGWGAFAEFDSGLLIRIITWTLSGLSFGAFNHWMAKRKS
jgi:hypothetical protein